MDVRRPKDKGVAAYAVAMSIGATEMGWDDVHNVAERLRSSTGLSAAGLWAVMDAIKPFVRLGHGESEGGRAREASGTGEPAAVLGNNAPPAPVPLPPALGRVDLKKWALQEIERVRNYRAARVGRGHTYTGPSGRHFHLRSMHPFDRGSGRSSYWFGLPESCWNESDVFVLACGTDGILVVPVGDWLNYQLAIAQGGPDGTDRQPSIWLVDGRFELRVQGHHIDATQWLNRFDLL